MVGTQIDYFIKRILPLIKRLFWKRKNEIQIDVIKIEFIDYDEIIPSFYRLIFQPTKDLKRMNTDEQSDGTLYPHPFLC